MSSIVAAALAAALICPQGDSTLARQVAAIADREAAAGSFAGVIIVAHRGQPVVELARGAANRTRNTPNGPDTRYQLASGDKLFTKIAISQLVAEGRITLSDTVGRFLPDYPDATVRTAVTVEHLLTHRSGLGMYWNDAFRARREAIRTLDDVVALFVGEPLAFTPGERMQYSNNGYILLGRIIEVASGMSYYDYVQRFIFTPAGMTRTGYLTLDEWPADRAIGYTASGDNTTSLAYRGSSAGGGYATARDLLRLDIALRRGEIADTAVLRSVTARAPGNREVLANGGGEGANVEFSRVGDYTIIVLANMGPPAASGVLQQIVALLASQVVDSTLRTTLVRAIADSLVAGYIHEDRARVMADSLDAALRAGAFDDALDHVTFSVRLNEVLRRLSNDKHLSVRYDSDPAPVSPQGPRMRRPAPDSGAPSRGSPGLAGSRILPGNVGYVEIRSFPADRAALRQVDSMIAAFAHVRAVIIDLRANVGGSPELVQYLSTYFFDRPTHLVTSFARGMTAPQERWTLDRVAGSRLTNTPVYLLTSRRTISAGESFAFGLRAAGRVTIVGERTAGGGHFGRIIPLVSGHTMFLPIGRTYDPRTNEGWEAEGIPPDVEVSREGALERALELIRSTRRPDGVNS